MARPETIFQNRVRKLLGVQSDRVEIGMGSTVGFPDTVFWPSGEALPVEFKIGRLVEGRVKADFEPTQKLWWRKAVMDSRKAFVIVGVEGKACLVLHRDIPPLWGEGLPCPPLVPLQEDCLRGAFWLAVNRA